MSYQSWVGTKIKTKTFLIRHTKIIFGIIPWVLLIICLSIGTFIALGYFSASKPVSYLPEIHSVDLKPNHKGLKSIALKCSGYTCLVQGDGRIMVKSVEGDTILSNLTYYADYEGIGEKWGLNNMTAKLMNDSIISIAGEGQSGVYVTLAMTVHKDKPKLDISINTLYMGTITVSRESVVASFGVSVSEVYLKNRQVDFGSFSPEYWLQKQGLRFGNGLRSAMIYHTPNVSSLQLDTRKNLLFVNLDYYLDHPFINIPYQKGGGGKWVDLSKAKYIAGDVRKNNFSIYFGGIPKITPRFMLVPNGYLAGYIFTEHADGGSIKTHRAAYFGSEDISDINNATGGFAGHKIPVTKSVFYADPDTAVYSSIRDDPDFPQFLDFLDQLNATGLYDICLHTPENLNSNHEVLEESIKFMKNRFDTKSWIDHGMYSGQINREAIVADGLNSNSAFYSADLWEKYGTCYFWSPAVEMIRNYSLKEKIKKLKLFDVSVNLWKRYLSPDELQKISFYTAFKEMITFYVYNGELNSLKTYKGNSYPTPLAWQHFTRTRDFYSWVTDYEKIYSNLSDRKVNIEKKLLDNLISDWGVFFNHGYFVRNTKDDVLSLQDGKIVINPYFDKILEMMAQMRDKGDLCITTIKDLLDYWILTDKISFDYMPDGTIFVNNANKQSVKGLSLVVMGKTVTVDGETPKLRQEGDNTIFWFDIPANQRVRIQVEQ